MEEPTVCELQFKRESVPIGLRVCRRTSRDHCQTLFETEGSFSEICVPFWRALRNLESRFSAEEFSRRWGRPLPAVRDGKADRNPETPTVLAASAISACDVIYFAKCTRTDMVVAPFCRRWVCLGSSAPLGASARRVVPVSPHSMTNCCRGDF